MVDILEQTEQILRTFHAAKHLSNEASKSAMQIWAGVNGGARLMK